MSGNRLLSICAVSMVLVLASCGGEPNVAPAAGDACKVDSDCIPQSCQTATCNPSDNECDYVLKADYCLINDSTCVLSGEHDTNDLCKVCDPAEDTSDYVAVQCQPGEQCSASQGCIDDQVLCQGDDSKCVSDDPCFVGSCDSQGICAYEAAVGQECDDGEACTENDVCDGEGVCAGEYTCVCETDDQCPAPTNTCKKAVCTDTQCTEANVDDGAGCDDEDGCTEKDACVAGTCEGTPLECTGGDACNDPVCTDGACTTEPANAGQDCDDDDTCTEDDVCGTDGTCSGDYTCPCTIDTDCPSTTCNTGVCTAGACGLESVADGTACEDGLACTAATTCQAGACSGGNEVTCSDTGNPCTYQECENSNGGCVEKNASTQMDCNDGLFCTANDHCDGAGGCVGGGATLCPGDGDQNECTTTACDEAEGGCVDVKKADGDSCAPSTVCIDSATCTNGICVDGDPLVCEQDSNPCTTNVCTESGNQGCGEQDEPSGTSCGDSQSCSGYKLTKKDACNSSGTCVSGSTSSCGDHFTCNSSGSACRTSCSSDAHCVSPWECNSVGKCSCYPESYYQEYYFTSGESWGQFGCGTKRAQTFLAPGTMTMTSVVLRLKKVNDNPCTGKTTTGQVTLGLYKTDSGKPTGSALVTKTKSVSDISTAGMGVSFGDFNYKMQDGTTYAFVLSTNSTTHTVRWASRSTDNQGKSYTDGKAFKKIDPVSGGTLPAAAPGKIPETTPAFGWTEITGKDHYFSFGYDIDCTDIVIGPMPGIPDKP